MQGAEGNPGADALPEAVTEGSRAVGTGAGTDAEAGTDREAGTDSGAGLGTLLGSGRTADVYAVDEEWVLRRCRAAYRDMAEVGAVMAYAHGLGYPVPRVRPAPLAEPLADLVTGPCTEPVPGPRTGSCARPSAGPGPWPRVDPRTDLVMERLSGPTMLDACAAGRLAPGEAGRVLAGLLRALHALPARTSADPAVRVLHLDLHPENVILTPAGPRVVDWDNTEEGAPGLDWGMSAVILAQVAVSAHHMAQGAREMLAGLLAQDHGPARDGLEREGAAPVTTPGVTGDGLTEDGLNEAVRRRAANPTMSPEEVELLPRARELVLRLAARPSGSRPSKRSPGRTAPPGGPPPDPVPDRSRSGRSGP